MNIQTGEVRWWDDLTPEQKASGMWIQVPDGTEGGAARPNVSAMVGAEPAKIEDMRKDLLAKLSAPKGGFDAVGKPR